MSNRDLQDACQQFHDRSSRLTILNLSGKGLGSGGVKCLAESCLSPRPAAITSRPERPYHCPLVVLWMENNDLFPRSMEEMVRLFAISPSLRHLHLSHNFIGDDGVRILASVAAFRQLHSCSLADNYIGPVGAQAVAEQLRHAHCVLERLNLNGNNLRDDGVINLVEGLKMNTSLKSLDLRYNHVSLRGLRCIREMLANGDNMTLETLQLEEEDEDEGHTLPPPQSRRGDANSRQPTMRMHQSCFCDRCQMKSEIAFYLNLNRAGRHDFTNLSLKPALWSRILAKSSSMGDPSLLHAALLVRPDITLHSG